MIFQAASRWDRMKEAGRAMSNVGLAVRPGWDGPIGSVTAWTRSPAKQPT
jgi:hypothetical protein